MAARRWICFIVQVGFQTTVFTQRLDFSKLVFADQLDARYGLITPTNIGTVPTPDQSKSFVDFSVGSAMVKNFYFRKMGWVTNDITMGDGEPDFYKVTIALFSNNAYSILYIVLIAVLGFHLNHAFQAAFQSLGLNHPKYTPCIKSFSTVYSIIIAVGFCIIPIFFMFFK